MPIGVRRVYSYSCELVALAHVADVHVAAVHVAVAVVFAPPWWCCEISS
jgi:hypothetical protein